MKQACTTILLLAAASAALADEVAMETGLKYGAAKVFGVNGKDEVEFDRDECPCGCFNAIGRKSALKYSMDDRTESPVKPAPGGVHSLGCERRQAAGR